MGNHPIVALMFYDDAWNDITTTVAQTELVALSSGGGEFTDQPRPSIMGLSVNDPDNRYQPHNPNSPLYGKVGRYTPLIVGESVAVEDFEDATYTVTIGNGASDVNWARSSTQHHSGSWSYRTGSIGINDVSEIILTPPSWSDMMICWVMGTGLDGADDLFAIYAGDNVWRSWNDDFSWAALVVPVVTAADGTRTVRLSFSQDSGSVGSKFCYLDDVQFIKGQLGEAQWRPNRTIDANQASGTGRTWSDIDAGGVLRRLGRNSEALRSPLYRALAARPELVDLWPGEDGSSAKALSSATGGQPGDSNLKHLGYLPLLNFGQSDCPAGAASAFSTTADSEFASPGNSYVVCPVSGDVDSMDFSIGIACKLPALIGPVLTPVFTLNFVGPDRYGGAAVFAADHGWNLGITDLTHNYVDLDSDYDGGDNPDQWVLITLGLNYTSTSITYRWSWYPQNGGGSAGVRWQLGSFAIAQPIQPMTISFGGNLEMEGLLLCGLFVSNDHLIQIDDDLAAAFDGWLGENVIDRGVRLGKEEGFGFSAYGTSAQAMGIQRPDTITALLREIRDTESGLLSDSRGDKGVELRTRESLYGQTVKMALTFPYDIAPPFLPAVDEQGAYNVVTASNREGGYAVAVDSTSMMGTQSPPDGIGVVKQTVNVSVYPESSLQDVANFWMRAGTNPEARWSSVTIDCDGTPALETTASTVRAGDRITVTGATADLIDLLVVAVNDQRENQKRRTITFLCVPYRHYDVAIYSDTTKRYDSRTSTLNAGYSATATTMVVTFTNALDAWSTTGVPYDWGLSGERIRVTAMGAVTGSGPYTQSATVTRSINGVSRSHLAGDPVHMHPSQQARYAL